MMASLKSFIVVIFFVLISILLAWFYLNGKGLSRSHAPFQAGFFSKAELNNTGLLIALRGESFEFPENSLPAFESAAQIDPSIILWADVLLTQDGVPVITRYQDLSPLGVQNSYIPLLSFAEIQKIDAGYSFQNQTSEFAFRGKGLKILSLEQLIRKFPKHRFILNLADDSVGFEQQLVKAIQYNDKTNRFIITSERDKIIKQTRTLAPMLFYGASTPQLTQLMILANIFLESLAKLDSDILIVEKVSEKIRNSYRVHLNEKMILEAHRRSLKVFAGNAQSFEEANKLTKSGVDGVISNHPLALKDFYKKHDFSR